MIMRILSSNLPLLCQVIWSFISMADSDSDIILQITPQTVVLLSQSPPQTSFVCGMSGGMYAQGVARVYDISLSKSDQYEKVFATANDVVSFLVETAPTSLRKPTAAVVSGGIDNTIPESSTLKVDFETNEMVCADAGSYKCSCTYKGPNKQIYTLETQTNLSVHALPSEVTLTAQTGGIGVDGTLQMPLEMTVNESIQFTCNGKIGSEKTNLLRYRMSSMFDNTFNIYQGNVNHGSTSAASVDCTYTRSSTMTYVVQDIDAVRENYLAFKCFVTDRPPIHYAVTQESGVFYIKVKCNTDLWGHGCTTACGHCMNGTCNSVDGHCITPVCQPGYKTTAMCAEVCDTGSWGPGCAEPCGHCLTGKCDPVDGTCSTGCQPDYKTSPLCLEVTDVEGPASADIGPIVGGLVGALVFIAVIAGVVVLYKKGYRITGPGNKSDKNSPAGTTTYAETGPGPIYEEVDEDPQAGAESQDERITADYEMLRRNQSENITYDELPLADPPEYENTIP